MVVASNRNKRNGTWHREWAEVRNTSRSGMRGPCVRGEVATGTRGHAGARQRGHGPHHRSHGKTIGCGGWDKIKCSGCSDQSRFGWRGGGTERETRVIRTRAARHTFTQRLHSMLSLVPHFTLDQPHFCVRCLGNNTVTTLATYPSPLHSLAGARFTSL